MWTDIRVWNKHTDLRGADREGSQHLQATWPHLPGSRRKPCPGKAVSSAWGHHSNAGGRPVSNSCLHTPIGHSAGSQMCFLVELRILRRPQDRATVCGCVGCAWTTQEHHSHRPHVHDASYTCYMLPLLVRTPILISQDTKCPPSKQTNKTRVWGWDYWTGRMV